MDNVDKFEKVKSLRYGQNDIWCHRTGHYLVEGPERSEGSGPFFFHQHRRNLAKKVITVVCKSRRKTGCQVEASITESGRIVYVSELHNRTPDNESYGIEYRETRSMWITDIREYPTKKPEQAILQHRRKISRAAATTIVLERHLRTARHHASKVRPGKVKSLRHLYKKMKTEDHLGFNITHDGEKLMTFFNKKRNILVFTTPTLLSLLKDARVVHADATYKVVPRKLSKQLFTIHGNWKGHVGMIACALMNSADAKAYRWVFRCLKRSLPGLSIHAYMGDYDKAMRKAVTKEFPDAKLYGCLFHYSQALVKKASNKAVGMAADLRKPGEILSNFLAFTALPLLPAQMILPAFRKLSARALGTHVGFPAFLAYVSSFWLEEIGAENLSVYGLCHRTNNDVESNNSKLLRRAGPHGPVWSLVSIIADFAQDVAVNKLQHDKGIENILSKPNKSTKANKLRIVTSWEMLMRGELTDIEFLDRVKYKVGKINHRDNLAKVRRRRLRVDPTLEAWLEAGSSRYPEEEADSPSTVTAFQEYGVDDEVKSADSGSTISVEEPDSEVTVSMSESESDETDATESVDATQSELTWSGTSDEEPDAEATVSASEGESSSEKSSEVKPAVISHPFADQDYVEPANLSR